MRHLAPKAFASLATTVVALLFAQPVWAMTPVSAAGSFFFTSAPTVTLLHSSEGNTLVRLDFPSAVLTGDIAGTFSETLFIRTHRTGDQNSAAGR